MTLSAIGDPTPRGRTRAAPGYGKRIQRARLDANKTQPELADALGVHPDTVRRWESERSTPADAQFVRIARVTRVTASWLLYGDES
jgi:transcriptional regulator with XRE-family HTH domain